MLDAFLKVQISQSTIGKHFVEPLFDASIATEKADCLIWCNLNV